MRNLLVAVCCAALVGSVSVASAQTTAPADTNNLIVTNAGAPLP